MKYFKLPVFWCLATRDEVMFEVCGVVQPRMKLSGLHCRLLAQHQPGNISRQHTGAPLVATDATLRPSIDRGTSTTKQLQAHHWSQMMPRCAPTLQRYITQQLRRTIVGKKCRHTASVKLKGQNLQLLYKYNYLETNYPSTKQIQYSKYWNCNIIDM